MCIDGVAKQLVIAKATGKVDILAELANARLNDDTACPGDEVLLVLNPFRCFLETGCYGMCEVHATA